LLSDYDAMGQLLGLAQSIYTAADDMPLTDGAHSVSDNLDELEDRVQDVTGLIVQITHAAAFADREADRQAGALADATRRRVVALAHAAGALAYAAADLGDAVAQAGLLHRLAALSKSPEHAQRYRSAHSVLDDRLDSARRHLHEAGRQLGLEAQQLAPRDLQALPNTAADAFGSATPVASRPGRAPASPAPPPPTAVPVRRTPP
jgi:hypothetical protein